MCDRVGVVGQCKVRYSSGSGMVIEGRKRGSRKEQLKTKDPRSDVCPAFAVALIRLESRVNRRNSRKARDWRALSGISKPCVQALWRCRVRIARIVMKCVRHQYAKLLTSFLTFRHARKELWAVAFGQEPGLRRGQVEKALGGPYPILTSYGSSSPIPVENAPVTGRQRASREAIGRSYRPRSINRHEDCTRHGF